MIRLHRKYPFLFKAALAMIFFLASHPHAFFGYLLDDHSVILYVDIADVDEDIFIQGGEEGTPRVEYQEESRNDSDAKGSLKLKQQASPVTIPSKPAYVELSVCDFVHIPSVISTLQFPQKLFHPPQV